jgi:hypothetical protein
MTTAADILLDFLTDPRKCGFCGKSAPLDRLLRRCSACKGDVYCDERCQRYDWDRGHKYICELSCAAASPVAVNYATADLASSACARCWKFKELPPDAFTGRYAGLSAAFAGIPVYVVDEADLTPATKSQSRAWPAGSTALGVVLIRYARDGLNNALDYLSQPHNQNHIALRLAADSRAKVAAQRLTGFPQIPRGDLGRVSPPALAPVPVPVPVATQPKRTSTSRYYPGAEPKSHAETIKLYEYAGDVQLSLTRLRADYALTPEKAAPVLKDAIEKLTSEKKKVIAEKYVQNAASHLDAIKQNARLALGALAFEDYATAVQLCLDSLKLLYGSAEIR